MGKIGDDDAPTSPTSPQTPKLSSRASFMVKNLQTWQFRLATVCRMCVADTMMMHLFRSRGWGEAYCNLLLTVCCISIFAHEVPTGILADKYGYRKSLICAMLLLAGGRSIYAFSSSYTLSIIGQIIEGAGHACNSGSVDALLFTMCRDAAGPDAELAKLMYQKESSTLEMLGGFWGFGSCVFAGVAGFFFGFEWLHEHCLWFYALQICGYLVAMGAYSMLPDVEVDSPEDEEPSLFELPKLLSIDAQLLIIQLGMWQGLMYICKYQMAGAFLDSKHVPESWVWLMFSLADSLAGLVMRYHSTSKWLKSIGSVWVFQLVATAVTISTCYAWQASLPWGIPAVIAMGAFLSFAQTMAVLQLKARLQLAVQDEFRATALNLCSSFAVVHQQSGTLAMNTMVGAHGYGFESFGLMLTGYFGCTLILQSFAREGPSSAPAAGKVANGHANGKKKA
mmetsp:Transcript_32355/g.58762  ORF Transcript_32355/g.58762 Transcript_32355/m.58762 type:complete len:451 (-) Transcript_32355:98-1450(-)